jgi:peptide subunit release factor 1 (eRF1)
MMKMAMTAHRSIAKDVDEMLMEILCVNCHHRISVTFEEVRMGKVIPCPNCEAWIPLWDVEGMFQDLHDMALSVDGAIEASRSQQ